MSRIRIVTPGTKLQLPGNWRTAMRYQQLLIDLGHTVNESGETLTLLCACHDPARCHRTVLADLVLAD